MKIKEGFMLRQFGEEYIVVAVGDDAENFNKLITLNSVGKFIYDRLMTDCTEADVAEALIQNYEVDEETARRDAGIFIGNLAKAGLLDE